MVFIRKKKIKGHNYFYLVRSIRREGKVKQITLEYLGAQIPSKKELVRIKKRSTQYIQHK